MNVLRTLWSLLTPSQRRQALLLQLTSLVMAAFTVLGLATLMPFFAVLADPLIVHRQPWLAWLFEASGIGSSRAFLVALGLAFLGALLAGNALLLVGNQLIARFVHRVGDGLRVALFEEYLRREYGFHRRAGAAALSAAVLHEADRVTSALHAAFVLTTQCLLIVLVAVSVALLDLLLAALVLPLLAASYALVYTLARRQLLDNGRAQSENGVERLTVAAQALASIGDVLLTGRDDHFVRRFALASQRISRVATHTQLLGHYPRHLLECIAGAGLICAALMLSADSVDVAAWLPALSFIALAAYRLLPALQQCYFALVTLRAQEDVLTRHARELRHTTTAVTETALPLPPGAPRRDIALVGVAYTHEGAAAPVLEGLNLRIRAGTVVGLAGANGAGKTTVLELLLGLREPHQGHLEIDGLPLAAAQLASWRRRVACVPQHIQLLDDSLRANIAFGLPPAEVDTARVWSAVRQAGAEPWVRSLRLGLEERLGEAGARLSGGQRQLVAIARALYRDPAVLVFDEASSALDSAAESVLVDTVARLRGSRTLVLVSHRPAALQACDVVLELEGGRVRARSPASRKVGTP